MASARRNSERTVPSHTSPGKSFVMQMDGEGNATEDLFSTTPSARDSKHPQPRSRIAIPTTHTGRALGQARITILILVMNAAMLWQHRGQLHTLFFPIPISYYKGSNDSTPIVVGAGHSNSLMGLGGGLLGGHGGGHGGAMDKSLRSCELCVTSPNDMLCEYGLDQIKMSRGYEGSGYRVRKFLEKAIAGKEVKIGIIGASVSLGHGVSHKGLPAWWQVFYTDFKKQFPRARVKAGLVGGTDSRFHSYCFPTVLPTDLDLYIVELDINNEPNDITVTEDDALHRALLGLPQQPAVIRISVMMLIASELSRGATSCLISSQFFDIPVITMRNNFLPHFMLHPKEVGTHFVKFDDGRPDTRHISEHGHQALGDMLILYMRKMLCETRRRMTIPAVTPKEGSVYPQDDILGVIPRLQLWKPFSDTYQAPSVMPTCQFAGSKTHPMQTTPFPSAPVDLTTLPSFAPPNNKEWSLIAWNDKSALSSRTPGSRVILNFTGASVGIFMWETQPQAGQEGPGKFVCWIDNNREDEVELDSMNGRQFPGSEWTELFDKLERGKHTLTCEVLEETRSGGHDVRILGLGTH